MPVTDKTAAFLQKEAVFINMFLAEHVLLKEPNHGQGPRVRLFYLVK